MTLLFDFNSQVWWRREDIVTEIGDYTSVACWLCGQNKSVSRNILIFAAGWLSRYGIGWQQLNEKNWCSYKNNQLVMAYGDG